MKVGDTVYEVGEDWNGNPVVETAIIDRITSTAVWLKGTESGRPGLAFGCRTRYPHHSTTLYSTRKAAIAAALVRERKRVEYAVKMLRKLEKLT